MLQKFRVSRWNDPELLAASGSLKNLPDFFSTLAGFPLSRSFTAAPVSILSFLA